MSRSPRPTTWADKFSGSWTGTGRYLGRSPPRSIRPTLALCTRGKHIPSRASCLGQPGSPPGGTQPNWQVALQVYAPYVALNRMHRQLQGVLQTLGLAQFTNPIVGQAPISAAD